MKTSRKFIFTLLHLVLACSFSMAVPPQAVLKKEGWSQLDSLLNRIKAPVFSSRDFDIKKFGAVGDGSTDCSKAIRKAIESCNAAGGGRVVVPKGVYKCGPIYLKSNVNLHLEAGGVLSFSTNPKDYLPLVRTRWEGVDLMNYSPLIYAFKEKNIAITGNGKLDGCASNENWWSWKGFKEYGWVQGMPSQSSTGGRKSLFEMGEKGVAVNDRKFGEGFNLRPQFIQPYLCDNILIEGVEIVNSPMWIIHPVLSNNIVVKDVTIKSGGPNTDGIDPESCKDVLIKNCVISTGDDCIALKSGRNADGRRINVPCENVIIQKCKMTNGHGGVVIGSEISGGVRNIFAEDCTMDSPLLDRALRIKSSSVRGGITENVYVRNIEVGQVKGEAIIITMFYEDAGAYMPTMRNIEVENMHVSKGGTVGIVMEGYRVSPIENIRFSNIKIDNVKTPYRFENVNNFSVKNLNINGLDVNEADLIIGDKERKPGF